MPWRIEASTLMDLMRTQIASADLTRVWRSVCQPERLGNALVLRQRLKAACRQAGSLGHMGGTRDVPDPA